MTHTTPGLHLVSLGCAKNWVDSEIMLGYLHQAGYRLVPEPHDADVIVVNTCAFIQDAKEEAIETILEMAIWKQTGRCRTLVVTGCLPQRYGYELLELLPEVDIMLGPGEVPRIVERIRGIEYGDVRTCYREGISYLYNEGDPRVLTLQAPTAYVKIADGCSNRCAYCAVPVIRGPLRSRPISSIVGEARNLVEQGIKEIILVAQDTTAFGMDRPDDGDLPALLQALDQVDGLEWIRLMYAHPAHVTEDLLKVLAQAKRICPYLDLPVQHINANVLRRMKRKVGPQKIRQTIGRLREAVPGISLRTSLIVGFPGETESAFQELLDFVEETRFLWLGVFAYSREENTPAASLDPVVNETVAQERLQRLMENQQVITRNLLKKWIGRVVPVLVERKTVTDHGEAVGRTPFQAPEIDGAVYLRGRGIAPGCIQRVRIMESLDYDLVGEVQNE